MGAQGIEGVPSIQPLISYSSYLVPSPFLWTRMPPRPVSGGHNCKETGSSSTTNSTTPSFTLSYNHDCPDSRLVVQSLLVPRQGTPRNTTRRFCNECVTQDNAPGLIYVGNWFMTNEKVFGTTHSTTARDASVTFSFNGTKVIVFGTVPKGDRQSKGPTARYILDNVPVLTTTLPVSTEQIRNQPFFAAQDLNTSIHTLRIEMVQINQKSPYVLQHFFVRPHNSSLSGGDMPDDAIDDSDSDATGTTDTTSYDPAMTPGSYSLPGPESTSGDASSHPDPLQIVKILAAVLGAVVALVIVAMGFVFIRRRMAKTRASGNVWSKFFKYSPQSAERPRPETMFTSFTTSESIMRNDPVTMLRGSSAYTRSDGRSDFRQGSVLEPPNYYPGTFSSPPKIERI
ncbi:hypothetical protein D9611_007067 [Ephemerocybe angulata]|uniref:Uncharacterized protein n=1 Tax=Ephemerocybe angulata TaxID=980116 RepID=A0A8H5B2Z0_9AGAR|nr:hypothetical protein D9611_007067 [Tulosesus angulatus]